MQGLLFGGLLRYGLLVHGLSITGLRGEGHGISFRHLGEPIGGQVKRFRSPDRGAKSSPKSCDGCIPSGAYSVDFMYGLYLFIQNNCNK